MSYADFIDDEFVFMEKRRIPDNAGGYQIEWNEGSVFRAKALRQSGSDLLIAQQNGAKEIYKIMTFAGVLLARDDYIKRKKDESIFKITSDPIDGTPPEMSDIKCVMVYAERTTL